MKINKINKIKNEITSLLQIEFDKDSTSVVFSRDYSTGGLLSIDLKTFQLSQLEYSPKIGVFGQSCQIDKERYFFLGGLTNRNYSEAAYIINIKERSCISLPNGPAKLVGGSVVKDNKVYIFGGSTNKSTQLATCETFDLITYEWKSLHHLPHPLFNGTASLLNNNIILSGNGLDCLY